MNVNDKTEGGGFGGTQLDRIEWMLHQLLARVPQTPVPQGQVGGAGPASHGGAGGRATPVMEGLPHMTTKQHATLQLVMRGFSNGEIAHVLGVTDNTAKVHVRTLARKMGVRSRTEIGLRGQQGISELDEREYERMSGGLPKTWGDRIAAKGVNGWRTDPLAFLYRNDVEEHEAGEGGAYDDSDSDADESEGDGT